MIRTVIKPRQAPPATLFVAILAAVAAATLLVWLAGVLAERRATAEITQGANQSAALLDALLASEIERYRALPLALGTDADVRAALLHEDGDARARLGDRLDGLARRLGAAAIYVIDTQGITIVSSNARTADSFVGQDYRFRAYFSEAMKQGSGAQFALGNTTFRPGLYLSQRVDEGDRALGVLVVKAEFLGVEADWARAGKPAFVTDEDDRVLITSLSGWRFRKLGDIGLQPGDPLPRLVLPGSDSAQSFLLAHRPTAVPGWKLGLLAPVEPRVGEAVAAARAVTILGLGLVLTTAAWLWRRRRKAQADIAQQKRARAELEANVAARTAELRETNEQLRHEMEERRRIEEQSRQLHQELEQANRLATLGQIAAGVTHEINQPVAAIRATADNAATLIARNDISAARRALDRIAKLTERIGAISSELRTFAAKTPGSARALAVDAAIDGALLLVGSGLRHGGILLQRGPRKPELKVKAERVRLEQILVNLLQNAIDALEGTDNPEIRILVDEGDGQVCLRVEDNGPGVSPEMAARLFTPFRTSKARGLGLGLVISRDIAAALGGELDYTPKAPPEKGARFCLLLPKAR